MKPNYTLLALLCIGLSVPLAYYFVKRRSPDDGATVRIATFNVALNRAEAGALLQELEGGKCEPAKQLASLVQTVRPDVLLLNEVDRDPAARAAEVFRREYLGVSQGGRDAIEYPFVFCGAVNTGVPSGQDLDGDGRTDGPADAYGYGRFPGQYGMVLLSRYPILEDQIRTFQKLRWSQMPDAQRPKGYYSDEAWQQLRLSSKSHWDVPIGIGRQQDGVVLHALCSHPTPPSFDGAEDRNGCRNHDEIRFWGDYLTPGKGDWIVDDGGTSGGLAEKEDFVVLGDLNCDPRDGDSRRQALLDLLGHDRVQDFEPRGDGGAEQKLLQFGRNMQHQGDPALDTGDFGDGVGDNDEGPGNLRVDYVLPSRSLQVARGAVLWPKSYEPALKLCEASDHRMVWIDVRL
ncbi:MAG: endonuclease/exonuclease/phosphatase family protein [Planctomycetota bacterium]